MQAEQIVKRLQSHPKGSHVKVCWRRKAKTFKDCALNIEKETCAWVRAGINYSNLEDVKNGIAEGTRKPVGKLPYGNWRKGFENYIIDHTRKDGVFTEQVRLYPAVFENLKRKIDVEWFVDGRPTTYEAIEQYLLAEERKKEDAEEKDCFNVTASTVQWVD